MTAPFTAPTGETVMPNGSRIAPGSAEPGVTPTTADIAGKSGHEIFNMFARAYGAPQVQVPLIHQSKPDGRAPPPSTSSLSAPSPQELEASRIAQFDAEQRAAGNQLPLPTAGQPVANNPKGYETAANGMRIPNGQGVDTAALEKLNSRFSKAMTTLREERDARDVSGLPRYTSSQREKLDAEMRALTREHEAELAKLLPGATTAPQASQPAGNLGPDNPDDAYWQQPLSDGRGHLTAVGQQYEARIRAEYQAGTAAEQRDPANIDATNVAILNVRANADGMVPVESFHPDMLHGYQLPKLIPDQHFSPDIIPQLARARAAGMTQQQLDAYIREDMRSRGFNV